MQTRAIMLTSSRYQTAELHDSRPYRRSRSAASGLGAGTRRGYKAQVRVIVDRKGSLDAASNDSPKAAMHI